MKPAVLFLVVLMTASLCAAEPDGFGRFTTGGAGGTVVTPSTPAEFQAYVETPNTPYIVLVEGTLSLEEQEGGRVRIHSNKTVRGVPGTNPTIIGELDFKNGDSNIIIEDLTITNPYGWREGDGVSIKDDIVNVLVTRCTIYDCEDGLLDITRRSDNVTVSWCKFYFTQPGDSNNRVSLIGGGDSHDDDGKLHITFHHNWFSDNCWQRIPSVRYGRVHLYNNYYNAPGNLYGVRSRIKAEVLIENNFFRNINDPYYVYIASEPPADYGKIGASGNLFENCTGTIHPGTDVVFDPPYDYDLYPAERVPALIVWGAGANGREGYPPHWFYGGIYGDFDYSGVVDLEDLAVFAACWLAEEDIDDADYNEDGIVDFYEFALLANNWMIIETFPPAAPENLAAVGQNGQVALLWDENSEEDLRGYYLYRSTIWNGEYSRLNAEPLAAPGYFDTDVVNGVMYYYLASAVNYAADESDVSIYACAVPNTGEPTLVIQEDALGFCGVDGIIDYGKHSGFTGAGFADAANSLGTGIDWRVNIAQAGNYTFTWRYANGGTANRPGRLLINGSEVDPSVSFPQTGAWNVWSETSLTLYLSTGIKNIRLEGTLSDSLANIDYLQLTGPAPEALACP